MKTRSYLSISWPIMMLAAGPQMPSAKYTMDTVLGARPCSPMMLQTNKIEFGFRGWIQGLGFKGLVFWVLGFTS